MTEHVRDFAEFMGNVVFVVLEFGVLAIIAAVIYACFRAMREF